MGEHIVIKEQYKPLKHQMDEGIVAYNIEFAEITGGTFWREYTAEQMEGKQTFVMKNTSEEKEREEQLMQIYPPIDLYEEKLRYYAKTLGAQWIRVSGTWATTTYYDFSGECCGQAPEGYQNVLTKEQWCGVLDFVKNMSAKLLISVSNCEGVHHAKEPWNPKEAEKIFSFSKEYGVPIAAVEFTNEPNLKEGTGTPQGYTDEDFRRDEDIFFAWVRKNYPECLCVGPSIIGPDRKPKIPGLHLKQDSRGLCERFLNGANEKPDIFSYHFYNGVSERLASQMPMAHARPEQATSETYLVASQEVAEKYAKMRARYCRGEDIWVTESGDACGGGNTWASTYLDVIRTLNEMGGFAKTAKGILFHNTLCASDYGFLSPRYHEPRPNYYAVLLWYRLMGTIVYDSGEAIRLGAHMYVHSRKDGKTGFAILIINNSSETTELDIPKSAEVYQLSGQGGYLRSFYMELNGVVLKTDSEGILPPLHGKKISAGKYVLAAGTCTFLIL